MSGVVVLGAGQAGAQVAASLREEGFCGPIQLVGDEPGLPYQRPPLSKAYLRPDAQAALLQLRAEAFYQQHGIDLVEGRAEKIDRQAKRVVLADARALSYDHLVLATGARNRRLPVPGAELDGVVSLRTLAEADALRARLPDSTRAVVVGAGFIGLEFAAFANAAGIAVTVIEATGRPMARALSGPTSEFFRDAHRAGGVRLILGATVSRIRGVAGRATAVETADGAMFPADLVLVGIGVVPNAEIAADAGLPVENGVIVDETLLTADPAVSALGDCAAYPQSFAGGARMRLESVQNAVDQGRCVAARLVGKSRAYRSCPGSGATRAPTSSRLQASPSPMTGR
jgi:3-phenylpropionate/trans-cinnamate dioxygenase ferredoxin reductase subunit